MIEHSMISVLILTLNEEQDLPDCLASVAWCDDVVVLDSFSSDRTVQIAEQAGARVVQRKFDNWAAHQNWAMENIDFRHPWVFYLDADERMTDALRPEILSTAAKTDLKDVAFYVGRRNFLMGSWLRRAMPPRPVMRFFKPPYIRFRRLVNPVPEVNGTYGYLREMFDHHPFSKGLIHWLRRHNNYSSLEAVEAFTGPQRGFFASLLDAVRSSDRAARIKAIKAASYRLPGRDLLRFFQSWFLRLGMLDKAAGLQYCLMISIYEYWIGVKLSELARPWRDRDSLLIEQLCGSNRPAAEVAVGLPPKMALVDILIGTANDAEEIVQTIDSARLLGEVFVIDRGSTDGTPELARQAGATVIENGYTPGLSPAAVSLEKLPLRADWVLALTPGERITPPLRDEVIRTVEGPAPVNAYDIKRLIVFMGRLLKTGGPSAAWSLRLCRRREARLDYSGGLPVLSCSGPSKRLRGAIVQSPASSLERQIGRLIESAALEATEAGLPPGQRRPLRRGAFRIVEMFVLRGGFLYGRAGWTLARLTACHEYLKRLMRAEKMQRSPSAVQN